MMKLQLLVSMKEDAPTAPLRQPFGRRRSRPSAEAMTQRDRTTAVHAWCERITIPTYEAGQPDANPVFLEKRVYQGSSGAVYPYPVVESISDEKVARDYEAVFLENEYLKIMILPELGGRVQMALD